MICGCLNYFLALWSHCFLCVTLIWLIRSLIHFISCLGYRFIVLNQDSESLSCFKSWFLPVSTFNTTIFYSCLIELLCVLFELDLTFFSLLELFFFLLYFAYFIHAYTYLPFFRSFCWWQCTPFFAIQELRWQSRSWLVTIQTLSVQSRTIFSTTYMLSLLSVHTGSVVRFGFQLTVLRNDWFW